MNCEPNYTFIQSFYSIAWNLHKPKGLRQIGIFEKKTIHKILTKTKISLWRSEIHKIMIIMDESLEKNV